MADSQHISGLPTYRRTVATQREKAFLILYNQCWLMSWHGWENLLVWQLQLRRSTELFPLTHSGWNFLVDKPPHHVKGGLDRERDSAYAITALWHPCYSFEYVIFPCTNLHFLPRRHIISYTTHHLEWSNNKVSSSPSHCISLNQYSRHS